MSINYIKQQILSLTFNDDIDIITFRFLLMHLLVKYADAYKKISHTHEGLKMLQAHRKLEYMCAAIKENYRNNNPEGCNISEAKYFALKVIQDLSSQHIQVSAA